MEKGRMKARARSAKPRASALLQRLSPCRYFLRFLSVGTSSRLLSHFIKSFFPTILLLAPRQLRKKEILLSGSFVAR
jgi:hypothetical protein